MVPTRGLIGLEARDDVIYLRDSDLQRGGEM